jgi:uncharacterized protein (DUF983 family)
VKVLFTCPSCDVPSRQSLDQAGDWQCPACDHRLHFEKADPSLPNCAVCGNHELYKQKDFPHTLGLLILAVPTVLSIFTYFWYEKWLTWALLVVPALVDGLLYVSVGDAIVCYRCHAYHKGIAPGSSHPPFELATNERYRQERIRKEQLRTSGKHV